MTFEPSLARLPTAAAACGALAARSQRIDVRNPTEISRLSRELGISWPQLLRIVDRVGTDLRAVRRAVLDQHGVTWH